MALMQFCWRWDDAVIFSNNEVFGLLRSYRRRRFNFAYFRTFTALHTLYLLIYSANSLDALCPFYIAAFYDFLGPN